MVKRLSELIESRLLNVHCAHCGWAGQRELSWLCLQRDMNCPACAGVIVLNTSERKREIAALRRQVSSLHKQLADSIPAAHCVMQKADSAVRHPPLSEKSELSLVLAFRDSGGRNVNSHYGARQASRPRR